MIKSTCQMLPLSTKRQLAQLLCTEVQADIERHQYLLVWNEQPKFTKLQHICSKAQKKKYCIKVHVMIQFTKNFSWVLHYTLKNKQNNNNYYYYYFSQEVLKKKDMAKSKENYCMVRNFFTSTVAYSDIQFTRKVNKFSFSVGLTQRTPVKVIRELMQE